MFGSSSCDQNFLVTTTAFTIDTRTRLAWASSLDKESFERIKNSANTGASVLIDSLPISGYGDFAHFEEALSREKQFFQYSYSNDESIAYMRSELSGDALQSWIKCKEIESRNNDGIHLWITSVTGDSVSVAGNWKNPPSEADPKLPDQIVIRGSKTRPSAFLKPWKSNYTTFVVFDRLPNQDFSCSIGLAGYMDEIAINLPPPVATVERDTKISKSFVAQSHAGDGQPRPNNNCSVTPDPGWSFNILKKPEPVIEISVNNNVPNERLTKILSLGKYLLKFQVTDSPADAQYHTYTWAHYALEQVRITPAPPRPHTDTFTYP